MRTSVGLPRPRDPPRLPWLTRGPSPPVDVYDIPSRSAHPHSSASTDHRSADDRMADQFRRQYLEDLVRRRQRRRHAHRPRQPPPPPRRHPPWAQAWRQPQLARRRPQPLAAAGKGKAGQEGLGAHAPRGERKTPCQVRGHVNSTAHRSWGAACFSQVIDSPLGTGECISECVHLGALCRDTKRGTASPNRAHARSHHPGFLSFCDLDVFPT